MFWICYFLLVSTKTSEPLHRGLELGIFKKELAGVLIKTISPWKITIKIKLEKLTPYLNLKCNTLTYLAEGAPWQAK